MPSFLNNPAAGSAPAAAAGRESVAKSRAELTKAALLDRRALQVRKHLCHFGEKVSAIGSTECMDAHAIPARIAIIRYGRCVLGQRNNFRVEIRVEKEGEGQTVAPAYVL